MTETGAALAAHVALTATLKRPSFPTGGQADQWDPEAMGRHWSPRVPPPPGFPGPVGIQFKEIRVGSRRYAR